MLERGAGSQFDPEMVRLLVDEVRHDPGIVEAARREAAELDSIPLLGAGVGALTDNLTLLSSHRAFRDAVNRAASTAEMTGVPFTVLLVRLLDLKRVNRREGYAAGDDLLQTCARALDRLAVRVGRPRAATAARGWRCWRRRPTSEARASSPHRSPARWARRGRCG